jgi:hypothetical protein
MLRFPAPAPAELLQQAQRAAEGIDLDFLWECAPQDEFDFTGLADEYYGHAASAVEAASLLFRLHGAPVYFYRKGRGRYRPAPPDTLRAALAALERKKEQAARVETWAEALAAGDAPDEIRLDRRPNPHVAFGFGVHLCLGAAHARTVVRTLLEVLCRRVGRIDLDAKQERVEHTADYVRPLGYESVTVRFRPR